MTEWTASEQAPACSAERWRTASTTEVPSRAVRCCTDVTSMSLPQSTRPHAHMSATMCLMTTNTSPATRRLGRTGFDVTEVGYGAWGIGADMWIGADDQESTASLRRALDLGLTFIDTALAYGRGHSERLVGQAVREREQHIAVATKIPPKNLVWPAPSGIDPDEAYPADYVRRCTETSLKNLGVDVVDVQQFHVWSDEWVGRGS